MAARFLIQGSKDSTYRLFIFKIFHQWLLHWGGILFL
jgi:hypothetical protein